MTAPLTESPSTEARGYRSAYTDQTRRSSLLRFSSADLLDLLADARAHRRTVEQESGRWSFAHGYARGRIALLVDTLAERGAAVQ